MEGVFDYGINLFQCLKIDRNMIIFSKWCTLLHSSPNIHFLLLLTINAFHRVLAFLLLPKVSHHPEG
jgi:hypothetical protein